MSSLSSQIPPTSPFPSSPTLPVLTPHPPTQISLNDAVVNRPIREPVPPSKRAALHVADPIQRGQSDVIDTHAYLPKELAEIFMARQQQERAWQTRLLVCTSLFSCMENTVASFKEGEGKEMAKTIHAHLRTAISQFAISETCAPPLKVLQQTKGEKSNGIPNKNLPNKPTVAPTHFINATLKTTNALPKTPKPTSMSWTTVVRNGQKTTRLNVAPDPTSDTNLQPQKSAAKSEPTEQKTIKKH